MPEAKKSVNDFSMLGQLFPAMVAAEKASERDQATALKAGDYTRALGASTRRLGTLPVALADDVVGRPLRTLASGVPAFLGGLVGSQGSVAVPKKSGVARLRDRFADLAPSTNVNPRNQLRIAEPPKKTTPQEKQLAFLDQVFGGALTLNQATAATTMLPAPAKAQSAKDKLVGDTAALSQQIFANQVKQAEALAAADPVGAKDTVAKATDEYFKRQAAILGFNPMNLQMAEMMAASEGE